MVALLDQSVQEHARSGKPPPPPVPEKGGTFATDLGHYTYTWVELAPPERVSLHLVPPRLDVLHPDRGVEAFEAARKFRERLELWLDSIQKFWPECRAQIAPDGTALVIRPGTAIHRGQVHAAS